MADLASSDLAAVVRDADAVIFCVPIGAMSGLAETIAPLLKPTALVTDVGSVKTPVVEALAPVFQGRARFIGSHPMAGSEQSGLAAARPGLFEGATCILTPHAGVEPTAQQAATRLWEAVGCRVVCMEPEVHDRSIGLVSHLPHLLAAALVDFVGQEERDAVRFCGNGFRDTTRIAAGPAAMWTEILLTNGTILQEQLDRFIAHLQNVSRSFSSPEEMNKLLVRAKAERDRLPRAT